jgi:hypothetical protein
MKLPNLIIILSLFITVSCKNTDDCENCQIDENSLQYKDESQIDYDENIPNDTLVNEITEKKENLDKIVAKFGEQWDFCSCVVANDSINKAFEKDLNDKQAEVLMSRWEHVETKCKEFLTSPNNTPEERASHEKKVKKCLKEFKKK